MMWQPIETAPRDGTPILGYAAAGVMYVCWARTGRWIFFDDGRGSRLHFFPTHWMPLSAPPPEHRFDRLAQELGLNELQKVSFVTLYAEARGHERQAILKLLDGLEDRISRCLPGAHSRQDVLEFLQGLRRDIRDREELGQHPRGSDDVRLGDSREAPPSTLPASVSPDCAWDFDTGAVQEASGDLQLRWGYINEFMYRNHRGEVACRRVLPCFLIYGSNKHHSEPCWQLVAHDLDKQAIRNFDLRRITPKWI